MSQQLIHQLQETISLSPEQIHKIEQWVDMLLLWQKKVNLIAPSTVNDIWLRHVMDSLQLVKYLPQDIMGEYMDLGSGAGFPGLAVSLFWQGKTHLVDADQKKSIFLKEIVRSWGESKRINIHNKRIEQLQKNHQYQLVTARALAPLCELLSMIEPLADDQTMLLLPKGQSWKDEIHRAQKIWSFTWSYYPSITDKNAAILQITHIKENKS